MTSETDTRSLWRPVQMTELGHPGRHWTLVTHYRSRDDDDDDGAAEVMLSAVSGDLDINYSLGVS